MIVRRIQIAVPDASENLGAAYVRRLSVQRNRIPCASVPQISAMNLDGSELLAILGDVDFCRPDDKTHDLSWIA